MGYLDKKLIEFAAWQYLSDVIFLIIMIRGLLFRLREDKMKTEIAPLFFVVSVDLSFSLIIIFLMINTRSVNIKILFFIFIGDNLFIFLDHNLIKSK